MANGYFGSTQHCSKLTDETARAALVEARTSCGECGERPSDASLARKYGISNVAMHKLLRRKAWKHLNEPDPNDYY